jgi:hypothetical protein
MPSRTSKIDHFQRVEEKERKKREKERQQKLEMQRERIQSAAKLVEICIFNSKFSQNLNFVQLEKAGAYRGSISGFLVFALINATSKRTCLLKAKNEIAKNEKFNQLFPVRKQCLSSQLNRPPFSMVTMLTTTESRTNVIHCTQPSSTITL